MANKSERVIQLRKNFVKHHNEGWSVKQIADHYHVTPRYTYSILQEIADENGVTRESLLQIPHSPHTSPLFIHRDGEEKVNVEEVRKDFQNILTSATKIVENIDKVLKEDEQ